MKIDNKNKVIFYSVFLINKVSFYFKLYNIINTFCVRLSFYYIKKKSYISPKLIESNMVNNYATNIKRRCLKKYKGSLHN